VSYFIDWIEEKINPVQTNGNNPLVTFFQYIFELIWSFILSLFGF